MSEGSILELLEKNGRGRADCSRRIAGTSFWIPIESAAPGRTSNRPARNAGQRSWGNASVDPCPIRQAIQPR